MRNWKDRLDFPEDAEDAQKCGHAKRAIQARASFSRIVSRAEEIPLYKGVSGIATGNEIKGWVNTAGKRAKKKVEKGLVAYCAKQYGTTVGAVEKVIDEGWLP